MFFSIKNGFYNILFLGFFAGFFVAFIFIYSASKLFIHKKESVILRSQVDKYYYDRKVFEKPKALQTSNKISSTLEKKEFRIPIIMYHYVEYVKDPLDTTRKSLNINPLVFEKELEALNNNGYKTLFVEEIPRIISGETEYSSKSVVLTFDDGYEDFYTDVLPLLKKHNIKATLYIIYNFIDRKGFLSEKQIDEIIDSKLVEIGSHTLDHFYLKKSTEIVAAKQIIDSKKMFEDRFDINIETFAYPFGAFDQNAVDLVKSAGYTAAVSVIPEIKHSSEDLFYLYRVRAGNFSYGNIINFFENYKK